MPELSKETEVMKRHTKPQAVQYKIQTIQCSCVVYMVVINRKILRTLTVYRYYKFYCNVQDEDVNIQKG